MVSAIRLLPMNRAQSSATLVATKFSALNASSKWSSTEANALIATSQLSSSTAAHKKR